MAEQCLQDPLDKDTAAVVRLATKSRGSPGSSEKVPCHVMVSLVMGYLPLVCMLNENPWASLFGPSNGNTSARAFKI